MTDSMQIDVAIIGAGCVGLCCVAASHRPSGSVWRSALHCLRQNRIFVHLLAGCCTKETPVLSNHAHAYTDRTGKDENPMIPDTEMTDAARAERALDTGWRFFLGENEAALQRELDDTDWQDVRLPHDWAIHCPSDPEMEQGKQQGFRRRAHVGWYRRRICLRPEPGRRVRLRLDGAYRHAEVWINGHSLGLRPSGYATRIHDITEHLREDGDQLLAVRCDNTGHDADRWYCGAGLYRRVWLTTTGEVAVEPWGVSITTPEVSGRQATVAAEVTVRNHRGEAVKAVVSGEIVGPDGKGVATLSPAEVELGPGAIAAVKATAAVSDPALWSPALPELYTLRVKVEAGGEATDRVEENFGIREVVFSAQKGLEVNGEAWKMRGVCMHHDLGALGTAFFEAGWERRLRTLKEHGFNAIRTSHNPPDPALLDLCDRLGFFVIDEAFDKWQGGCSGETFDAWWKEDVKALVLRDRNHPSVIVWSIGNEVENQCSPTMLELSKMLCDYVKELEPTRPTLVALRPYEDNQEIWLASPEEKGEYVKQVARTVDIVGLNYQDQWYDVFHEMMPEQVFIATEAFHFFQHRVNASWALHAENPWLEVEARPYVAGQFLWTGIEYLGEAGGGWPVRGWTGAPFDCAGYPKPRAYWHAAAHCEAPVVHAAVRIHEGSACEPLDWSWPALAGHWSLPVREGDIVEVWVFGNGHSVELQINDAEQGTRLIAECPNRIAQYYVPYRPGTLVAISRDEAGNELARHELKTAGEAAKLSLTADKTTLRASDVDLAHLTVEILDEAGTRLPHASDAVSLEVAGAGRLVAMDNGDLTCHEPYGTYRRSARKGRCLGILRAGHTPGEVTVTARVDGLPDATLTLQVE
jgi:beta-galactosidase